MIISLLVGLKTLMFDLTMAEDGLTDAELLEATGVDDSSRWFVVGLELQTALFKTAFKMGDGLLGFLAGSVEPS